MWVLVAMWCSTFPAGEKCGSYMVEMYHPSEDMCRRGIPLVAKGIDRGTVERGGNVRWFTAECYNTAPGEDT